MKRLLVALLLASPPLAVLAQQGSILRESQPPDDSVDARPLPPDDSVVAVPLLPPDQEMQPDGDALREMVPNPLQDPDAAPAPGGRPAQPQGQPQRGAWLPMGTATLQALDKVNVRNETMTVKVGDDGHFGSLDIAVRGCFVRTPDRPTDATAFLVIRDQRADSPAFTGWMVRSAPYMSMLAHPIYDIRITGCAP
jgi:hypothetical protein